VNLRLRIKIKFLQTSFSRFEGRCGDTWCRVPDRDICDLGGVMTCMLEFKARVLRGDKEACG